MGLLRRDGRLRPGTLWILFVVALLAGAATGWAYRWWTDRTVTERAIDTAKELKHSVEKVTK